jgi:hypothetical protein
MLMMSLSLLKIKGQIRPLFIRSTNLEEVILNSLLNPQRRTNEI